MPALALIPLAQHQACPHCRRELGKHSSGPECPICRDGRLLRLTETQGDNENFGFQWNRFAKTQLDSANKTRISETRLRKAIGRSCDEWEGKLVLEIGCGAGRFSEILLQAGGQVVAVDQSDAVLAAWENLSHFPALTVLQADLHNLPLKRASFDCVICLGVLQHTPDPIRAFAAIAQMVRPGGELIIDVYEKSWRSLLTMKYWLRPLTTRIPQGRLFKVIESAVSVLLPVCEVLSKCPGIGKLLLRALPIAYYAGIHPLPKNQLREWAILDTYDRLSPRHDHPQTATTLLQLFADNGFTSVSVEKAGHLVGRGIRGMS